MARIRKDVWKPGGVWSDALLWYARGVGELQNRALDDRTSWRYLGAMHGFHEPLWRAFDYIGPSDTLPPQQERTRLWDQCQHQTWYFLPWHRGYLAAFEMILLDAITKLGGPSDWALPYWNYSDASNPRALEIPPAFDEPDLPDGSPNPLKVDRRYGPGGNGRVVLPDTDVDLASALGEPDFAGLASGGSPGFGGPETSFSHGGGAPSGMLEDLPHNIIHVSIGGSIRGGNPFDPRDNGLMSMPQTAGLDPIFWLHHANIDRLWEVWLRRAAGHRNPGDISWLDGPVDRAFEMPRPDGTIYTFTARAMLDTTAPGLDYIYEDVSDPLGGATRLALRLATLPAATGVSLAGLAVEENMGEQRPAELVGANAAAMRLEGKFIDTQVRMDRSGARKIARSFALNGADAMPREPDRVFLNLENIRGANDSVIFDVFVELPRDADPEAHPERRAGAVSLFGISQASQGDATHGGNGLTKVLEITHVVDRLRLDNEADLDRLNIRFVPRYELQKEDGISVERVSVYRQGR